MKFSYLVTFRNNIDSASRISDSDLATVVRIVRSTPEVEQVKVYTPESARDCYTDDGPSPQLALQLYFDDLAELEAAIGPNGHLQALARPGALPSLDGADVTQQAMVTRPFPVLDPLSRVPADALPCSYLVHYPGSASDFNEWLAYYLSHHPQIMKFFPGIREIELFTRVDWCDAMPWRRVEYMQRNKLVFDSAAALTEALNSSVRHDMKADFNQFPAFEGSNRHYAMATMTLVPETSSTSPI